MSRARSLARAGVRLGARVCGVVLGASLALAPAAPPAAAQVAVGDSLWQLGRIDEAAAAYRRALEEDRLSVRANFRVAQTLAWGSNIDSALVLLRNARVRVPNDPDLLLTEATFLSWARRWDEALLRFDTLLTAHPGADFAHARVGRARMLSWAGRMAEAEAGYRDVLRLDPASRDARFGLAQLCAWQGDLECAVVRYDSLLASDPGEVRSLVGLGHVRLWQQRYAEARALAQRAAARDSTDGEVRELLRAVRAATGMRAELGQDWSEDSERNRNQWQRASLRFTTARGWTVGAAAASLQAGDPFRQARRTMLEGLLAVPLARGSVTGVLAARSIAPAPLDPGDPAGDARTVMSGRVTVQQRLTPAWSAAATISRWPFDEIASITPLSLDITQGDVAVDWRATARTALAATAGRLAYSDGNTKGTWSLRGTRRLDGGFSVGAYANGFAFRTRATRYFSPPRFTAAELTAGWERQWGAWSAALGAGLGAQRIDTLALQDQWHAEGRLARTWARDWTVELHGGRSTSAAASAVGAYAYSTLGLALRRTF